MDEVRDGETYVALIGRAAAKIKEELGEAHIALVLGSGLGGFVSQIEDAKALSYAEVPGMPLPTVQGHAGKFVGGSVGGKRIYCMAGRQHRYEGYSPYVLAFATRVFYTLGVKVYIATNAAGGAMEGMREGDLMALSDHVAFAGFSPMDDQPTKPDDDGDLPVREECAAPYSEALYTVATEAADKAGARLHRGTYWCNSGPTYETPAEVNACRKLGAEAFGMSTAPDTLLAGILGMQVAAFSLVTNLAAGMTGQELTHDEVADTANKAAASFETFMKTFISDIDPNQFDNSKRMPLVPVKHAALPQPCPRAKGSEQIFHSCADLALQLGVLSDCGSCGTKFCNKYSSTLASSPTAVHYVTPSVAALVDFKRDIMASLVDGKCVAFSDVDGFPVSSTSGRNSYFISGKHDNSGESKVILILSPQPGLDFAESCFVAQVFSTLLSVHTIVSVIPTSPMPHDADVKKFGKDIDGDALMEENGDGGKSENGSVTKKRKRVQVDGGHLVVTDAFNFSTAYPVPHGGLLDKEGSTRQAHERTHFRGTMIVSKDSANFLKGITQKNFESTHCAFYPGPLYPTKAEVKIGAKVGCEIFSTANHGLFSAMRSINIDVHVATCARSHGVDLSQHTSHIAQLAKELALGKQPTAATWTCEKHVSFTKAIEGQRQLVEHIEIPLAVVDYNRVKKISDDVLQQIAPCSVPPIAFVVDRNIVPKDELFPFDEVNLKKKMTYGELISGDPASAGTIYLLKISGTYVLLIRAAYQIHEGSTIAAITARSRMLGEIGVKYLLGVSEQIAVSSELASGDIVLVTDSVNLSQRNPLFGPNEEKWGPRFPDMQKLYKNKLLHVTKEEIEEEVMEVITAFVTGPVMQSSVMTRYYEEVGAKTVCTGIVPEAVAAHHMGILSVMIGLVTSKTFGAEHSPLPNSAHFQRFRTLLSRLVPQIKQTFFPGKVECCQEMDKADGDVESSAPMKASTAAAVE